MRGPPRLRRGGDAGGITPLLGTPADDQRQCNTVEGKIGQGKLRFGMGLIREKIAVTQGSPIALNVLVMNLEKLLDLFCLFAALLNLLLVNQSSESVRTLTLKLQINALR